MKRRALCLLCLFLILSCGIAVAHENNTTDLELDETLKTSDDVVLSDDSQVNATKSGIRNITFSDGYNGYCINLTKDHADVGSVFTPKDTSHAMNNKYNTPIGNYLKILFVDFYDTATTDSDAASEVIWDFSDRYYLDSSNSITQAILKLAEDGRIIPDHGQTKQIDEKTEATFDFEVFDPLNDDLQNYFGYKITLKEIENDTSESNDTDITNETDTNTTDEISSNDTDTNSTNGTDLNETDNNTANETSSNETDTNTTNETDTNSTNVTETNETDINATDDNETNDTVTDMADIDENFFESSAINSESTNDISSIAQNVSNATGNPILLLLLVLSILGFGRIYRKY